MRWFRRWDACRRWLAEHLWVFSYHSRPSPSQILQFIHLCPGGGGQSFPKLFSYREDTQIGEENEKSVPHLTFLDLSSPCGRPPCALPALVSITWNPKSINVNLSHPSPSPLLPEEVWRDLWPSSHAGTPLHLVISDTPQQVAVTCTSLVSLWPRWLLLSHSTMSPVTASPGPCLMAPSRGVERRWWWVQGRCAGHPILLLSCGAVSGLL